MSNNEADLQEFIKSGDAKGLLDILDSEEDWMTCFDAAEALAQLGNAQGLDYLIDALQDHDEEKRSIAREILEGINSRRGNLALRQIKPTINQRPENVPSRELDTQTDNHSPIPFPKSRQARFILVLITFAVALIIAALMGEVEGGAIAVIAFPIGLLGLMPAVMNRAFASISDGDYGEGLMLLLGYGVLGWILYVGLALFIVRTTPRRTALILYVSLIFLLVANVAGCNESW